MILKYSLLLFVDVNMDKVVLLFFWVVFIENLLFSEGLLDGRVDNVFLFSCVMLSVV